MRSATSTEKRSETRIRPATDLVLLVRFDLRVSLELSLLSKVVRGGRYRTRTCDLVRVKHAL